MDLQKNSKQNQISDLKIRPVSLSDISRLHSIEIHSFKGPFSRKMLEKLAQTPNIVFLVGEIKQNIIGYVINSLRQSEAHLISIVSDEKYRRRGFSSVLIQNVIKKLQEKGIKKLKLEVRVGNEVAKAFYAKFNFKIIKNKPRYYSDGEDALEMELDL